MGNLKQNVSWMFLGNAFYAFAQWAQLTIVAKWSNDESLGNFTLYLAIVAPIFMFTNLQLRAVQVTDAEGKWRFSDFFTLRLISNIFSLLAISIISLVINPKNVWQLYLIGGLKILESFSEVFNSRQQLNEQMKNVSISFILKGIALVIGLFFGLYFYQNLTLGLAVSLGLVLIVVLYNDYYKCRPLISNDLLIDFNKDCIKRLFITTLPLAFVMLIISLNTNILKYFVEHFLGTKYQGIYSSLSYLLVLGNFVNSAVGQAFIPRLSKLYSTKDYIAFKSLSNKFVLISLFVGIGVFLFSLIGSKLLLTIFFNKEIAEYYRLFEWIMFSGIFMYVASSLGYVMTAMKIFKAQPYLNGGLLLLNIFLGLILIKAYGIHGVVYSSIIIFAIQILVSRILISKVVWEK